MKASIIKKVILGLCFTGGIVFPSRGQQNIQFSQYIFNAISINPAYAGYKEEWFAQMALRNQWVGIEGAPRTGQFSVDGVTNAAGKRAGVGLQLTADQLGPQSATAIYANYAYRLQLDADDTQRLSFGLAAGVTRYGLDVQALRAVSPDDPYLASDQNNRFMPDFRVGVYYYNPKWYLGASVMDLISDDENSNIFRWNNSPTQTLNRKRHLYVMTGALLNLSPEVKLRPSVLVKEDFAGPTSLDLNAMAIVADRFWFGASYRTGVKLWAKDYADGQDLSIRNALSGIAQFNVNERLRIGYSYDYSTSTLNNVESGTHEVTIGLTFPRKGERMLSPRFF